jgi:hypothetical protein
MEKQNSAQQYPNFKTFNFLPPRDLSQSIINGARIMTLYGLYASNLLEILLEGDKCYKLQVFGVTKASLKRICKAWANALKLQPAKASGIEIERWEKRPA